MSNIAEKIHDTALKKGEEYSKSHGCSIIEEVTYGRGYKSGYIEGYNQAMQDMLEKACGYLAGIALTHPFLLDLDCFTKYMQDE